MPFALRVPDASLARPTQIAVAVTVALWLLAGCSFGGSDPAPTATDAAPRVTAAPTLSPTPSPTSTPKPERPAAMDAVSVEGAIAAVTYFMVLYPYASNTGDISPLKELSHPDCIFCKSVTDHAEQMHALGQRQIGTETRVLSARGSEVNPGYWFSVDARVEQEGWQIIDAGGSVVDGDPTLKTYAMNFAVIHQDGSWLVRGAEYTVE
jgi:hypothetical protein